MPSENQSHGASATPYATVRRHSDHLFNARRDDTLVKLIAFHGIFTRFPIVSQSGKVHMCTMSGRKYGVRLTERLLSNKPYARVSAYDRTDRKTTASGVELEATRFDPDSRYYRTIRRHFTFAYAKHARMHLLDPVRTSDILKMSTENKEVHMAQLYHSPLPHVDFKVLNRFDPDDFGRKCRVSEIEAGRHVLQVKSKHGFVSVGQAPFATVQKAIDWANQTYSLEGTIEVVFI